MKIRTAMKALAATAMLSLGLVVAPVAKAEVEYLMVPSAAMGRSIPVAFSGGGPHSVVLLDAFNAGPEVSNWVTAGNAMSTLSGRGISVAAPAGGAYSLYTNWERDGSRQWETFLATELPDWLAANKGIAPGGNAIVGVSQGGTAALTLATFYPNRYRYAGSMSGFLTPSNTWTNGAITAGMMRFGGVDANNMYGPAQALRWSRRDPLTNVRELVGNGTRVWLFSPNTPTASDPAAMIGYAQLAASSNRAYWDGYRMNFGDNYHADFPDTGDHSWSSWGPQLQVMAADLVSTIK